MPNKEVKTETETADQKMDELLRRKQELELKKLAREVEQMETEDAHRADASAKAEAELKAGRDSAAARQKVCSHLKGGIGVDGFHGKGNSSNYAVIKHTYPWGETRVSCQRCGKEWRPGDPDYQQALNFPTDNTSSSSSIWVGLDPERVAELQHQNR